MDKELVLAAAFGAAAFAAGAAYVYLGRRAATVSKPSRPAAATKPKSSWLSLEKLLAMLRDNVEETRAALREVFRTAEDLQARGVSGPEVQQYAAQMFPDLLAKGDKKCFEKHAVTERQVTRAVAFYGDNVQVRRLMDQMDQMLDSLMPAKSAELPGGWTEDSFAELMEELMSAQTEALGDLAGRLRKQTRAAGGSQNEYVRALSQQAAEVMDGIKRHRLEEAGLSGPEFATCLEAWQGNPRVQAAIIAHQRASQSALSFAAP